MALYSVLKKKARVEHLTTDNVAHNKAYISGVARRIAEYVTKHSV